MICEERESSLCTVGATTNFLCELLVEHIKYCFLCRRYNWVTELILCLNTDWVTGVRTSCPVDSGMDVCTAVVAQIRVVATPGSDGSNRT